ncbi:transcriptional regulator, LacI family [Zobellia uliginosa]|uniref:Transcriptional regulator, LacI family n=1 Tax=Zobellia uliginosa TaxID=143224 RepID=A0ABY1KIG0_9FLAO|nr:LacI family DNA-binding transcriptional regulator [Zobellia uliginosa]SIS38802.1 transcriptional regulator, LacI family [Zobellia uliginosa]
MDKKQTTLKDIAAELNVSISTVSRALQGNPRISIKTREKVLELAQQYGYFQTKYITPFSAKKINAVGVIVPSVKYHLYAMAISGIEEVLERHHMQIIICQSNESYEREKILVKELTDIGVAGLIVSLASETKQYEHFATAKKKKIPLVFFNRLCEEVVSDKVIIDNFKAAYDATQHLIAVGCTRIAYIGGPEKLQISETRLSGYRAALQDAHMAIDEKLIENTDFTRDGNLSTARKLLYSPDHPDGILTFSDQVAIGAMMAAKERGLRMPEELAIIGFNNEPVDQLLEPTLTSIDQPSYEMGKESAQLIVDRIADFDKAVTRKVLKSQLVIRNSTNRNRS